MHRLLGATIGLALLSGCAFSPQLKKVAVDHDQMVADASDEMMLRNILRAKKRYPLHFTSISEVNGGVEIGAEVGLAPTFVGTDEYNPTTGASISTNPSFKMGVLDTKEFQRGIQTPISDETIAYYLDAGWPDAVIMSLFVERIELFDQEDDDKVAFSTIVNEPDATYGFGGFMCDFALSAYKNNPEGRVLASGEQFTLPGRGGTDENVKTRLEAAEKLLALMKNEEIVLDAKSGNYLYKPSGKYTLYFRPLENQRCEENPGSGQASDEWRLGAQIQKGKLQRGDLTRIYRRDGNEYDLRYFYADERTGANGCSEYYADKKILRNEAEWQLAEKCFNPKQIVDAATGRPRVHDLGARIVPRSVGDIIYFLGEYIRESEKVEGRPYRLPTREKLIEVLKGRAPQNSPLSTELDGDRYYIPSAEDDRNRSMQVLTVVQQLLNMHKSADALPRSISVTGL